MNETTPCAVCEKPENLCVCESVKPIDNEIFVLILRHPQEQDRKLGTARIATLQLKNSLLKTGLSWGNLGKALGRKEVDPKKWGVLFLGTAKTSEPLPPGVLTVVNRKGGVAEDQRNTLRNLEGVILLDGSWQQAKALWWRNAWLLKCRRLVLQPPKESLYGNLRKEPRKESVSTIEAAAYTLAELEKDDRLAAKVLVPFEVLLKKARSKS
jgi:DTW domain-containing protein YfiP